MKVERLVEFLLDKGYSAKDTAPPFQNNVGAGSQLRDSVVGLVVSRAGKALVQRLINQGADIYMKHQHFHDITTALAQFGDRKERVHDVTTLHMASFSWNMILTTETRPAPIWSPPMTQMGVTRCTGQLQALDSENASGRTRKLVSRIGEIFRLLLSSNPASINLPDNTGSTPLHYTIQAHAACGGSKHAKSAIQCLLEHGADPRSQ
ncbi:hypothetical protein BDW66DRAFT_151646 [Aspergillus desertorum]